MKENPAKESPTKESHTALPPCFNTPVKVVFTDVDDTLTWEGRLPASTFVAMEELRRAGIRVIPVTGASAGWCDCIVRTWPVDAVIGENGSFWMQPNRDGHIIRQFREAATDRERNFQRLKELGAELKRLFPEIDHTQDQPFRLTDVAFDIAQQANVDRSVAEQATRWLLEQAVSARLSSIHINAWIGSYNKAETAIAWLRQNLPDLGLTECAFIGDSPNDEAMFEHFPLSVGVSNIRRFLGDMQHLPRYITESNGGHGFVEFARSVLAFDGGWA